MSKAIKSNDVIRAVCVVVSALVVAFNLNTFVNAGGLFPGGFNGLSVFIQRFALKYFSVQIPFSAINILLNSIPAIIGYRVVGKKFTIFSCVMIFLTGVFVDVLPIVPITEDILLIAVFGGIINGTALAIALKGRASSGGTDFIAMAVAKKLNAPAWNYIMAANAVMLFVAGYVFGWDKALYSIIFQFCSTQMINLLHTQYKRMTIFIVTDKPDEIICDVMEATHHGFTRFEGRGGYSYKPRTMLYTVIDMHELKKVRKIIKQIDQHAFINVVRSEHVEGRFYQRPMD
ncbi:MAG: YitT family protein [Erysipelotrichia bacterium]|nr:YitT family protein [Erysipelotrichia bacterium]NCC54600.1 YitT family protein [Erysipelotrichia bacterium]